MGGATMVMPGQKNVAFQAKTGRLAIEKMRLKNISEYS